MICSISDRWATTSSADVGSSMITSSGVKSRAMAIIARWRMPPLSWWGKLLRWTASMPTSRITSADRSWIFCDVRLSCACNASRSCAPTVSTGLSAFIALCITTEHSRQRQWRSSSSPSATMSCPLKRTVPSAIQAGGLRSCAMA